MAHDPATLVIGPTWLGDAVMAQCLFKALKQLAPYTAIDVTGPPRLAPLWRRMPEVRNFIPLPVRRGRIDLPQRLKVGRALRHSYARAYVLPNSWKSAIVPFVARIAQRIGYLGEMRYGLLNDIRPMDTGMKRQTAWLFRGLATPGPPDAPVLTVDEDNRRRLCRRFETAPGAFVALVPGAEFGPAKRWPVEHYASFAKYMIRAGLVPLILGSEQDRPVGEAIAALSPPAKNLCGYTDLDDAIDLLSAARLAVTNDSGLMHVAAAVGTPLIAIYGSTSPGDTPPLSRQAEIVSLGMDCSPCHKRRCPLGHLNCLNGIDSGLVVDAARRLGLILQ